MYNQTFGRWIFLAENEASEPWPSDAELYQPFEVEQILLPDNASCLSVQAFLRMCDLNFNVQMRGNAEFMSPSGRLPFLRAGKFVIAELDHIITFVNSKGISLTEHMEATQKADMRAYMSLVTNVLGNAENWLSWNDPITYNEVTHPRYGSVFPWPLSSVLVWQKKRQVLKKLAALRWTQKTLDEVYTEVENTCDALSQRLDRDAYFFNNRPTELDALVYGHLFTCLTTPLPDNRMAEIIRNYKNLVDLCQRIDKEFFNRSPSSSSDNFERI